MEDLEQQVGTTEQEQAEPVQPAAEPEAPLTRKELEEWERRVLDKAEETARKRAQVWAAKEVEKVNERFRADITAKLKALDDPKLNQYIPDDDAAKLKAEYQAQLKEYQASEPEPEPSDPIAAIVQQAAETLHITLEEVPPTQFKSFQEWHAAAVQKSEAKRHNPNQNKPPAKPPLPAAAGGSGGPAGPSLDALIQRQTAAYARGDMAEGARLSAEIDQRIRP